MTILAALPLLVAALAQVPGPAGGSFRPPGTGAAYVTNSDRYLALSNGPAGLTPCWMNPDGSNDDPGFFPSGSPMELSWNPSTNRFLAVWIQDPAGAAEVYGSILEENPSPIGLPFLRSTPFAISSDPGNSTTCRKPRIACDGTRWLVVWEAGQASSTYARGRMVGDAAPAQAPRFLSTELTISASIPDGGVTVAFGAGGSFLVAWFEKGGDGKPMVRAAAIPPGYDPAVNVIYKRSFPVYRAPVTLHHLSSLSIAANGVDGEFLLGWIEQSPIYSVYDAFRVIHRAGPDATPIGSPIAVVAGETGVMDGCFQLAWVREAGQYLVAWLADDEAVLQRDNLYRLRGIRLDSHTLQVMGPEQTLSNYSLGGTTQEAAPAGEPWVRLLPRAGATSLLAAWRQRDGSGSMDLVLGQVVEMGPSASAPVVPALPSQFRIDGISPLAVGADTVDTGFTARASATTPDSAPVRIELELREVDAVFDGHATATSAYVPSGTPVSMSVTGLIRGRSYHWQVRAVTARDLRSAWVAHGPAGAADFRVRTNNAPTVTPAGQYRLSTGSAISPGEALRDDGVRIEVSGSDPEGDDLRLELEVRPRGDAFTGAASFEGGWMAGAGSWTAAVALPAGEYQWRVRVVDALGADSGWVSFGGGDDGADFILQAPGGSSGTKACGASVAGLDPRLVALLALLFVQGRTRTN